MEYLYLNKTLDGAGGKGYELNYSRGTVILRLWPFVTLTTTCANPFEPSEELKQHTVRQKRDYSMAIMLFWYQKERMEKTDDGRAMGIVIKELAQYLKKKHIPFCFPRTNSGKHREDWARVVYYQPPDPTLATQA